MSTLDPQMLDQESFTPMRMSSNKRNIVKHHLTEARGISHRNITLE